MGHGRRSNGFRAVRRPLCARSAKQCTLAEVRAEDTRVHEIVFGLNTHGNDKRANRFGIPRNCGHDVEACLIRVVTQ